MSFEVNGYTPHPSGFWFKDADGTGPYVRSLANTFQLATSGGVAESPSSPADYGAVMDGATPDHSAIQQWLDYAASLATVTGAKIKVTAPFSKVFAITAGITVDVSKVMVDWNGCKIVPSAAVTGKAITMLSTNNDQNAKGTQIMGGMQHLYLFGTGKTVGTGVGFAAGGLGVAHSQCTEVYVRNFLIACDMSATDAYLMRFNECLFNGSGTGLKQADSTNAGEAIRFNGGNINSNDMALDLQEGSADYNFVDTSFDFNVQIGTFVSCKVSFRGVHFENSGPSLVQFTASGARCNITFLNCEFWSGGTAPHPLTEWITATDPAVVRGEYCEFFNTRTSTHRFASGNVSFFNSYSHNSTSNNRVCSVAQDILGGDFEEGIPWGIQIVSATSNRLSAGGGTIAQSTSFARTGTDSMIWTKSTGVGDATAGFVIYIPLPHGASITWEGWHAKSSGGASENWFHNQRWIKLGTDGNGLYFAARSLLIGTSSGISSTTTWQSFGSSGFDTSARQKPAWADGMQIDFNMNGLAAQSIHFDDLVVNIW